MAVLLTATFCAGWWSSIAISVLRADVNDGENIAEDSRSSRNDGDPRIQAFFSPRGGTREAIIGCIDEAGVEVLAALYYFTDAGLADALARAHRRGARVEVLLDRTQRKARGGQAQRLIDAGVNVRFDERHRILHHKFAVIDGVTVVTGSFNWTRSAEMANAENTLVLRDEPELAKRYIDVFNTLNPAADAEESNSGIPDAPITTSPRSQTP